MMKSHKPQVGDNSGVRWYGNSLRFATREEALANAKHLMGRWVLVQRTCVIESEDPVTHALIDGELVRVTP